MTKPKQKRGRKPRTEGRRGSKPGPLASRTARPGHNDAVLKMQIAIRRARAVQLFVDKSKTYEEIAKLLGVSNWTVANDMKEAFEEYKTSRLQSVEHLRLLEIRRSERYDKLIIAGLTHKDQRVRNDTAAKLLASQEFRARLDGLYTKPDGQWTSEEVLVFVRGLTQGLIAEFTDDDQKRKIKTIFSQHSGHLLPDGGNAL